MSAGGFTGSLQVREKARQESIYVPYLNRWSQPDTIVPDTVKPQTLNRYSYAYNNPIRYNDPSGNCSNAEFNVPQQLAVDYATWIGKLPDCRGIEIAKKYVPKEGVQGVPGIVVAAALAIQSQYYDESKDTEGGWFSGEGSGLGYAQVSDEQMIAYGLAGFNQENPTVAVIAMSIRIRLAWDACGEGCTPKDKLILAALAQNGSGFDPERPPQRLEDGSIDWEKYLKKYYLNGNPSSPSGDVRQSITKLQYDTQFMVLRFFNNLRELENQGWTLPYEIPTGQLEIWQNEILNYVLLTSGAQ
ncbi:MAG: hypothetical protein HYZ26_12915 [Chloroflexi bacterium]|nr:hypothetical protein [Chloroflexota bacterium]